MSQCPKRKTLIRGAHCFSRRESYWVDFLEVGAMGSRTVPDQSCIDALGSMQPDVGRPGCIRVKMAALVRSVSAFLIEPVGRWCALASDSARAERLLSSFLARYIYPREISVSPVPGPRVLETNDRLVCLSVDRTVAPVSHAGSGSRGFGTTGSSTAIRKRTESRRIRRWQRTA